MSILIKGMEMPKEGTVIAIYKLDGKFYASVHGTELCPLVPVPKHGRLIDVRSLENMYFTKEMYDADSKLFVPLVEVASAIFNAPTIIEAEEDE